MSLRGGDEHNSNGGEHAVKGVYLSAMVAQLKRTMKERGVSTLPGLTEGDAHALRYERFLATTYYPIDFYHRIVVVSHAQCYGGNEAAMRAMGIAAARDTLGGVYRLFLHEGAPDKTLRSAPRLWHAHYRGSSAHVDVDGKGARVTIRNYGPMPEVLQAVNQSWAEECVRLSRGEGIRSERRVVDGDYVFELAWSRITPRDAT